MIAGQRRRRLGLTLVAASSDVEHLTFPTYCRQLIVPRHRRSVLRNEYRQSRNSLMTRLSRPVHTSDGRTGRVDPPLAAKFGDVYSALEALL